MVGMEVCMPENRLQQKNSKEQARDKKLSGCVE